MRTRIILISILIAALPLLAEAAGAPRTFKELAGQIFKLLTAGIATMVALGIVIYIWGIASNMFKLGEGDTNAYRAYIFWGVIIVFVMVSIVGIVRLMAATIFQGGGQQQQQQQQQNAPTSLLEAASKKVLAGDA